MYVFLAILSFLIISSACYGQSNWHVVPSLSISEAYNSNIFSNETDVHDYITRTGADIALLYNGSNMGLRGSYLAEYNTYAKHSEENIITHDLGINANLNRWFGNLLKGGELIIREDFTYTPDLRDYNFSYERNGIDPLSNYGIRRERSDTYMNAAQLNSLIPLTNRFNLSLSYSNLMTDNESPNLRDSVSNTAGFGFKYLFPKDTIYSDVSASMIRVGINDAFSYSFTPGIRHSFSENLILDINAGVVEYEPEVGDRQITSRSNLMLTKLSRRHSFNGGYTRSLNTVIGISDTPTIADLFYFNMTNVHSLNLNSNIGGNYAVNKSLDRSIDEEVDTTSYNISGGLSYTINKWLRCSFTVSHFEQESDTTAASDISRDQVILAFSGTLF
ncbi:MAG TPA: hypothetical protein DCR39_09165 [Nitrospiraceae bacterium]|nr:hypothetical protein [Nitrospiraceae bacterium]